jgi:hypothetical protein
MKKLSICVFIPLFVACIACNSSRKTETERQKLQEKRNELEKNKQEFEQRNRKELGK